METVDLEAGLTRLLAVDERERLKATLGSGVVDWGNRRRATARYEAYWRGMSIGLFASADEASSFLQTLG